MSSLDAGHATRRRSWATRSTSRRAARPSMSCATSGSADDPQRSGAGAPPGLADGSRRCPQVGEVRGLGLFIGIEVVADRESRAPRRRPRAAAIRRAAFERGVLLGVGGHAENVIKLCPPLTIDEHLLDAALELTIDTIRGAR